VIDRYAKILYDNLSYKGDLLNDAEAIIYAKVLGINIETDDQLAEFRRTIITQEPTRYREQYENAIMFYEEIEGFLVKEYVVPALTERYKAAQELTEYR
jgi:hypothetical protein